MKHKLKEPHNKTTRDDSISPPNPNIFKYLISALESRADIKTQVLKNVYYILVKLSSKKPICTSKGSEFNEFVIETTEGEVNVSLREAYTLSRTLFKNLKNRLKQLHSSKHDVTATRTLELEELNLLLRCCMVTLTLHVPQEHLLESGRFLLLLFKKLSLLEVADVKKSGSCQCMCSGEITSDYSAEVAPLSSLELFDTCLPSITTLLEVIIDELLVHGQLRKYLQIIDSYSPTNECLFNVNADSVDFGLIMDIICSHFSLSVSDDMALNEFLNRLTWARSGIPKPSSLGIISAKTLLQNPIFLSSPKLLQARIVSLVADVITFGTEHETYTPDCYLSVFESSVILYTQHMSILKTDSRTTDDMGNLVNRSQHPSFESCINADKFEKLSQMIAKLNNSWKSNLRVKLFEIKSDLISSSMDYTQQNICKVDVKYQDIISSFLKHMILKAADDVNVIELPLGCEASLQDTSLLASLLMLMSNSLIQALKVMSSRNKHDAIMGIMACFKEFSVRLPIQKSTHSLLEQNLINCNESKLMLLHFLGLLSLSFDSGLGFLVKSCVSVIMGLCNLVAFEEGNVDVLRMLVEGESESLVSDGSVTVYKQSFVGKYHSVGVAAKFQKTRASYLRNACGAKEEDMTSSSRETCNGEVYLKTRNVCGDVDDLADFIECQKDKDYEDWLKGRDKFRGWKSEKRVKRMQEKRKQAWRSMIGKT
ncbi:uncharacterized protein LOC143573501 [Bidens hawaiensis]|uniref:uncharacterized protein LOC143573501 n=1 Tax=Bidens hawaiensis TaxID=980011 RepID=UPI0040490ACF